MQISVIIPTLNAAADLPATLHILTGGAVDGIIREVIVADGGSIDYTLQIAEGFGAGMCLSDKGRGCQMRAGASSARSEWLLFLHADTLLAGGWIDEVRRFIHDNPMRAGVFRLKFDEKGFAPMLVAAGAMIRTQLLGMPYGDQGLLISRQLYDEIGGFGDMVLFEDVDIIQRIKRLPKYKAEKPLHVFNTAAVTSAKRYRQEGYFKRVIRNFVCIIMYQFGVPIRKIRLFYSGSSK